MANLKITWAWFVSGRAEVVKDGITVAKYGTLYARTPDDKIYAHKRHEFPSPRAMAEAVRERGYINTEHWTYMADDSEASAYFDAMLEPHERS